MRRPAWLTPGRALVLLGFAALVLLAVFGPLLWDGRAGDVDVLAIDAGASAAHPFGTDSLGRDMLARTLVATRLSLEVAVVTAVLGFTLGVLVGLVPVVAGGRVRRFVTNVISLTLAFPTILIVLLVIAISGPSLGGMVVALAVSIAPAAARLTVTLGAAAGGSEYVAAARALGVSRRRLLTAHVLPNVASPLALQFAQVTSAALLSSSALSFLGIGVQEPRYDWGSLLSVGLERIYVTPAAALGPAAFIVVASLLINAGGNIAAAVLAGEASPRRRRSRSDAAAAAAAATAAASAPDRGTAAEETLLRVEDLSVSFESGDRVVTPVKGVTFTVRRGERVGVVGESGSGKSLTALAIADLVEAPGSVQAGALELDGADVRTLPRSERGRLLGTSLAVVFQDPLSALNPVRRNGSQIVEGARFHLRTPKAEARRRALTRLRNLRIAAAERRLDQYPHELSGGMRQRVVIAMGLMTAPQLIVADEPTMALDVTVQREVLRSLREVNSENGAAVLLISHDIGVIRAFCERVLVMYAGRIVEQLDVADLDRATHPYTRALMAAVPDMETDREQPLATLRGRVASAGEQHEGCPFAPRCEHASERCTRELPPLTQVDRSSAAACWHPRVGADQMEVQHR